MLIIGIDPGITGSICFFQDGKIIDVIEMPNMTEGKKNKKQVNGAQIFHEISLKIKDIKKDNIKVVIEQVSADFDFQNFISNSSVSLLIFLNNLNFSIIIAHE